MTHVILVSADQIRFRVEANAARLSSSVKTVLDDLQQGRADGGLDNNGNPPEETTIPVANVQGDILGLFVRWAEHHNQAGDLPPGDDGLDGYRGRVLDPIAAWDQEFLQENADALGDLLACANQLDVHGLVFLIVMNQLQNPINQFMNQAMGLLEGLIRVLGAAIGENDEGDDDHDQDQGSEDEDNEEGISSEYDDEGSDSGDDGTESASDDGDGTASDASDASDNDDVDAKSDDGNANE